MKNSSQAHSFCQRIMETDRDPFSIVRLEVLRSLC
jgi:hypothetical protein